MLTFPLSSRIAPLPVSVPDVLSAPPFSPAPPHGHALQWVLGVLTALSTAVFLELVVFADGFRQSFGATENASLKITVALIVQGALLASIAAPGQRWLMHGVAVLVVALTAGCCWLYRESAFVGITGLAYCGLWLGYYWQALTGRR